MSFYQFKKQQLIRTTIDQAWEFISTPRNLREITPEAMNFEIMNSDLPDKMYPGMIISYKVSPLKCYRTTWVTEITHIKEKSFFIDEQRVGPYSLWHHQHIIEPVENGVLMTDIVSYKLPFGFLGSLAHKLFIRSKIESIFNYRYNVLEKRFNLDRNITMEQQ
jgi:ligand-binding SRPBCC domain-containing protein